MRHLILEREVWGGCPLFSYHIPAVRNMVSVYKIPHFYKVERSVFIKSAVSIIP